MTDISKRGVTLMTNISKRGETLMTNISKRGVTMMTSTCRFVGHGCAAYLVRFRFHIILVKIIRILIIR